VTSPVHDADVPAPPARPVSAVVVAGTHVRLARLQHILRLAGIEVRGLAKSVDEAVDLVCEHKPDTVLLDLPMGAGGLEVVERVMSRRATPIVITGGAAQDAEAALAAGAVDVVTPGTESLGATLYAESLYRHLTVASRVRVITHPRDRLRARGMGLDLGLADADGSRRARERAEASRRPPLVLIGASTGGPPALSHILGALPADLPASILVVQHMADGFVEGLATWLDGVVPMPVSVGFDGQRLRPGHVVLAPSHGNTVVEQGIRLRIEEPRPDQFHVPEIDRTFTSAAQTCRDRAVGVLLTGMGRDGAAGLLALRRVGAVTIGQDESSSAVWGMPGAAVALGAVGSELPLSRIAAEIADSVARLVVSEAV
jgi:two-component system chemotaxis response regulator CheB